MDTYIHPNEKNNPVMEIVAAKIQPPGGATEADP